MKITFEAKLKAGIKYDKEVKAYVTYAPALRVYSQGKTERQAKLGLEDAIQSFFIVAYKNGVLEKCLKNVGFSVDPDPKRKIHKSEEYIRIREEAILAENEFENIFEIPASLPLSTATA